MYITSPDDPKSKEEVERNLRIFEDAIKKNSIKKEISVEKLVKAKFADNMDILQWLYTYALQINPRINVEYNGYEKRIEAAMKQKKGTRINLVNDFQKIAQQFSSHLFPNNTNYRRKSPTFVSEEEEKKGVFSKYESPKEKDSSPQAEITLQRSKQLQDLICSLQGELSDQLNNHKLFLEDIEKIEKEREFYYNILSKMEQMCKETKDGEIKEDILEILKETPEDFKESKSN